MFLKTISYSFDMKTKISVLLFVVGAVLLCGAGVLFLDCFKKTDKGAQKSYMTESLKFMEDYDTCPHVSLKKIDRVIDTMFLGDLVNNVDVLPLETCSESLLNNPHPRIGWNAIAVINSEMPIKLFDRQTGEYVGDVGNIGRGPGEYHITPYDCQMVGDSSIFVHDYGGRILKYDMSGAYLGDIPISTEGSGRFCFYVGDSTVTIFLLPFPEDLNQVLKYDFAGNLLSVASNRIGGVRTYDYEISTSPVLDDRIEIFCNTSAVVYSYSLSDGSISPVFTFDENEYKNLCHVWPFPEFFLVNTMTVRSLDSGDWVGYADDGFYLISRDDYSVTRVNHFVNDLFYDFPIEYFELDYTGNFVQSMIAERIIDYFKEREMECPIPNLKDDDNPVILWGRLK